jgi:sec-independent protein translocase protein TatA
MFGLGFPELIVILVLALLIFGPRKLPELGSFLGKALRDFRDSLEGSSDEPGAGPPAHRAPDAHHGTTDAAPPATNAEPAPEKRAD